MRMPQEMQSAEDSVEEAQRQFRNAVRIPPEEEVALPPLSPSERAMAWSVDGFYGGAIITYNRANRLLDGELIDVSEQAALLGFLLPTAITKGLQRDIEAVPEGFGQKAEDRLLDVLYTALREAQRDILTGAQEATFTLYMPLAGNDLEPRYTAKMAREWGDEGEPVLTLMRESERPQGAEGLELEEDLGGDGR